MEALHDVVKAGKARYIGASAMWAWQFQQALYVAEQLFEQMQLPQLTHGICPTCLASIKKNLISAHQPTENVRRNLTD